MKLSIIVVNYSNLEDTLGCLESLQKLKWSGKKNIIVIDNSLDSQIKITTQFPQIIIISPPKNLGFAEANNVGVDKALMTGTDLVMLLNNDTKVDPELAVNLLNGIETHHADVIVPKIYFYPGQEFHHDRYQQKDRGKVIWYAGGHIDWNNVMGIHEGVDEVDHGQFDQPHQIEFATGCCLLIKKEVIEKTGLFDPKYYLYLEDTDFSVRAKKAGFKIWYEPQARLWHKNAKASGGSGSTLQDYYFTRNRLLFGMKYSSLRTKFALFRESLKLLISGSKWQKQGVIDFYLNKLGRGSFRN